MTFYRNLKAFLSNLWHYRRVLWNDRNYDYGFMLSLLHFKIGRMDDTWNPGHFVGGERAHREIKTARALLKRLTSVDPPYEAGARVRAKYPDYYNWTTGEADSIGSRAWIFTDQTPESSQYAKECNEHEEYMTMQDMALVYSILHKKSRGWWW